VLRLTSLLSALLIALFIILTPSAYAGGGASCVKHSVKRGGCTIEVTTKPKPGRSTNNISAPSRPSNGGGGGGGKCEFNGKDIPCSSNMGKWYSPQQCYAKPAGSEVADVAVANPGYSMYTCQGPLDPFGTEIALPNAALGAPAPPDPAVLARRALAQMGLQAVEIGIVPKPGPNSVGLVGMPTWMWVADPGPSTTGPITRTASEGGYTVTATGTVSKIVWKMGDGHSVVCEGEGTPYVDAYGKRDSPTCGYTYKKQGHYRISATSYWQIAWGGIGQTGVIPIDFTQDVQIQVGEAQVIVR